jgi:hypothetical protein
MKTLTCLFCNDSEKEYNPGPGADFICSQCIQLFLGADQEELKRAYEKAIDKGYTNKARAIESFLIPEGFDGQRKPVTKKRRRLTDRKRIVRTIRDKKKRTGRS